MPEAAPVFVESALVRRARRLGAEILPDEPNGDVVAVLSEHAWCERRGTCACNRLRHLRGGQTEHARHVADQLLATGLLAT